MLMLTMGCWSDIFHVLMAFLGEAICLLPCQDLLQAVLKGLSVTTVISLNSLPHVTVSIL